MGGDSMALDPDANSVGTSASTAQSPAVAPAGYRIVRLLGAGTEGQVFEGIELGTGSRVILKRVAKPRSAAMRRAFEVLRRTASPHLPAPRAFTASEDATWFITDVVDGETLGAGPVPLRAALAEGTALAHALAAFHAATTHHGDVAPGNVVVTPTGGVVLVDLGAMGGHGGGTPGFLAPECLHGGGGPGADVFALGSVLCFRLFGAPPWQRPERLAQVTTRAHVERRLVALAAATGVPARVLELLGSTLDPRVPRRPSAAELGRRLAELERDHDPGGFTAERSPVAVPRWIPYRGVSVNPALGRLRAGSVRLVLVAGAPGTGRGRIVHEIVTGRPDAAGAALVDPRGDTHERPWLDAWLCAPAGTVVGYRAAGPFAVSGAVASSELVTQVLRAGLSVALATAVLPVPEEVAWRLADDPEVEVVSVRPWTPSELRAVVRAVVPARDVEAWTRGVSKVSGRWPARAVHILRACERGNVRDPDPQVLAAAIDGAALAGERMSRGEARDVFALRWAPGPRLAAQVRPDLHEANVPHATAVVAARACLGPVAVRRLARAALARGECSVWVAIDGEDPRALVEHLNEADAPAARRAVAEFVAERDARALDPRLVVAAARWFLAHGDAERALAMAEHPDPWCRLERARAWHRRGELDRSLAELATLDTAEGDLRWRVEGLRWRVWVDRGEAARVTVAVRADPPRGVGVGPGLAALWAGYAAATEGDPEAAAAWLARAQAAVAGYEDPEAAGVVARATQLEGSLHHQRGAVEAAVACYAAAAHAFEAAGEPVGSLTIRGSLAGLCVLTSDTRAGLHHGRAVVSGLLARGQIHALPEAALNLVQLLVLSGRAGVAAGLRDRIRDLVLGNGPLPARTLARLLRVDAEIEWAGLRAGADTHARRSAEAAFIAAATALVSEAPREAIEAWVRAATIARTDARPGDAGAHLDHARAQLAVHDDIASRVMVTVEAVWHAVASGSAIAVERAVLDLRGTVDADQLRGDGLLAARLAYDRALLGGLRDRLEPGHPALATVAHRIVDVMEEIMQKTHPEDRGAVVSAHLSDAGEASGLREILSELEGERPAPATTGAPVRNAGLDDAERLLRMYRRFAREDRLEPLLAQLVDAMMDLCEAERGAVVVRTTGQSFEVVRELAAGTDGFRFSRAVIERVLESGEPVLSVDAAEDARFDGSSSISHLNLRSVLAVPLRFRGEVFGAAYVDHRLRRGHFDDADLRRVESFADLAALAVAHAAALAEVREQAESLGVKEQALQELLAAREAEVGALRDEARTGGKGDARSYRGMVGTSKTMAQVFRLIDRIADTDVAVVIQGESGTGKELVARAIHDAGTRSSAAFVAENCGAIPETLLESILFGHAKGSFTGAHRAKAGLFEAAHAGTIFLDEVSEMSPAMQTKLLRVLQDGEVRRVGETNSRHVDVRVIAASNQDLEALVRAGRFRPDLYYRINVVRIDLPALRDRPSDLRPLIEHLLARHGGEALRVSAAAMRALGGYAWPGNVRELENEVQRWVALCEGVVTPADLGAAIVQTGPSPGPDPDDLQIRPRVERLERDLIERALVQTEGNQTRAAQLLGLSRYGLQKKLRRLRDGSEPEGATP